MDKLKNILDRPFYERSTVIVAQELLGKILVFQHHQGIITETEAYVGLGDPACHAARGRTPRTDVMFGPAGFSYVYFIYGMYHCLNIVTEVEGQAAAVLIRGVQNIKDHSILLNGPGKLCRHYGITLQDNRRDVVNDVNFHVIDTGIDLTFESTPRIGISKGQDKLWRFIAKSQQITPVIE